MTYPLREKFTKKHVHAWCLAGSEGKLDVHGEYGWVVTRECGDCRDRQASESMTLVAWSAIAPSSVWHLADVIWSPALPKKRGCKP